MDTKEDRTAPAVYSEGEAPVQLGPNRPVRTFQDILDLNLAMIEARLDPLLIGESGATLILIYPNRSIASGVAISPNLGTKELTRQRKNRLNLPETP